MGDTIEICTILLDSGDTPGVLRGVICDPRTKEPIYLSDVPEDIAVKSFLEDGLIPLGLKNLERTDDGLVATLSL